MQQILSQLNRTQGVRGSMILNRDGIVVASDFRIDLDENGVGAVASSILTALQGAIKRINLGPLKRFTVTGNENKIVIMDAGPALLLVILQRDVNMGMVNFDIQQAAAELVEKARM
jgi:predicted regulator of Ras-like GTPase activity (Roadblock/LC7/MglB family)